MLQNLSARLSAAAGAFLLASTAATAANVGLDVNSASNGLTSIFSVTFDGALIACGGGSTTYCTFFGGDPGATRNVQSTPNPSGVIHAVPGGIGPGGIPVAPVPASGSFLSLTLGAGNTQVTLGTSSVTFGTVDICIQASDSCASVNAHAVNAGVVFNPTGPANPAPLTPAGGGSTGSTVPVDVNGRAVFQVQNAGAIVVDFSRFSQVVTNCVGASCPLITFDVLNLDIVRYVLEIDYDATFTSFTGTFIGQTSNNSMLFLTLNSASPDGDIDGIANGVDNCPTTSNPTQANSDADARGDACDNCTLLANLNQLDTDNEGYGNACDQDLNQSNLVTSSDFSILRSVLNQTCPVPVNSTACNADFNGSGTVTSADFSILRARLNSAPGPSGLSCAGTAPCPSP